MFFGMVNLRVISATEYKAMVEQIVVIAYGFHLTPYGKCLIGLMDKYICYLSFPAASETEAVALTTLAKDWPNAELKESEKQTAAVVLEIFHNWTDTIDVILKGTPFQQKVWEGLLTIPKGELVTYEQMATMIGCPSAVRATASAIGKNSVAYVVPCHRVVSKSGGVHKYRWGAEKKLAMINSEGSY